MLGKLLKLTTIPLDVVASGLDILAGGDGTPEEREDIPLLGHAAKLRDQIAEELDDIL
jgi:hypothetical protein